MKKIIALLLAAILTLSITAAALAVGDQTGTTTLTVEVPEPSYTIHIPADVTLTYGDTSIIDLGEVYVSDIENLNKYQAIVCESYVTALKNGSNYIPVTYYFGDLSEGSGTKYEGDSQQFQTWAVSRMRPQTIGASVAEEDWYTAVPGTYTATMTWNFGIH